MAQPEQVQEPGPDPQEFEDAQQDPPFRNPWLVAIDLSTCTGQRLWDEGTKPLEKKFSGQEKDLNLFLAVSAPALASANGKVF